MPNALVDMSSSDIARTKSGFTVPAIIAAQGDQAAMRFLEFFTVNIRNPNTRRAYAQAVAQFLRWCEGRGYGVDAIQPMLVAAYIESHPGSIPTVKQHLAAIKMLFDWLVTGQVVAANPATAVRAPKYVIHKGKTPVLMAQEARTLLDSIPTKIGPEPKAGEPDTRPSDLLGLRDRALIGVMVYSLARIGAVINMEVKDYYQNGKRWWLRLHEKGGRFHEVPAHHNAETYLDAYIEAAGIGNARNSPLFRSGNRRTGQLTAQALGPRNALDMVKRRGQAVGLPAEICNHTLRATGITVFRKNGGTIEQAQQLAGHSEPRTTRLYDRSSDEISLDAVERIVI